MSKARTPEEKAITRDRMRFIKNKSSANLTYLAILLDVFFFVTVYKADLFFIKANPGANLTLSPSFGIYYNILICGASVVFNLAFMLAAFLASEGLKNYQKNYSYLAAVIGVIQFVRIFIIPIPYNKKFIEVAGTQAPILAGSKTTLCILYLALSGACLLAAAVINYIKCNELEAHIKSMGSGQA